MDHSIKTLINVFIGFLGLILMLSCISFFMAATRARSVLYAVIQYVEVYGNKTSMIDEYAADTATVISVSPLEVDSHDGYRYQISVTFSHWMSWLNFQKSITYSSKTRFVKY
ncbi:MAG: hypothetical protein VB012_05745 [Erysipelotrichaceae bacterium]|nr:hypothetical protein [Erysipelotrichaceae bacterium]